MTGSGVVTRAAFVMCRKLLKVKAATAEDVGRLFDDKIDHQKLGKVDYSHLERVARRNAKVGRVGGAAARERDELDQALQGPERSRQLQELIWSREVAAIAEYEKSKEVKSFVAIGQKVMEPEVIEATIKARAEFKDKVEREERRARASTQAEAWRSASSSRRRPSRRRPPSRPPSTRTSTTCGGSARRCCSSSSRACACGRFGRASTGGSRASRRRAAQGPASACATRRPSGPKRRAAPPGGRRRPEGAQRPRSRAKTGTRGRASVRTSRLHLPAPPEKDATAGDGAHRGLADRRHLRRDESFSAPPRVAPPRPDALPAGALLLLGAFAARGGAPAGARRGVERPPCPWGRARGPETCALPQTLVDGVDAAAHAVAFAAHQLAVTTLVDVGDATIFARRGGLEAAVHVAGGGRRTRRRSRRRAGAGARRGAAAADAQGIDAAGSRSWTSARCWGRSRCVQRVRRAEPIGWGSAVSLLHQPTLSAKWRPAFEPWADALVTLPPMMVDVDGEGRRGRPLRGRVRHRDRPLAPFPAVVRQARRSSTSRRRLSAAPADVAGLEGGSGGAVGDTPAPDASAEVVAVTPAAAADLCGRRRPRCDRAEALDGRRLALPSARALRRHWVRRPRWRASGAAAEAAPALRGAQ